MPQKPRSQWSEKYRKRIERAEAKGLTRQQARGHKQGEHLERSDRVIRKFAIAQHKRLGIEEEEAQEIFKSYVTMFGIKTFRLIVDKQAELQSIGRGAVGTISELEALAAGLAPDLDPKWLYYR